MSMVSQTAQGAVLSVTSNVLAQALKSYQDKVGNTYISIRPSRQADVPATDTLCP